MADPRALGAALQNYDGPQKRDPSSFVRALLDDKSDPQLPLYVAERYPWLDYDVPMERQIGIDDTLRAVMRDHGIEIP